MDNKEVETLGGIQVACALAAQLLYLEPNEERIQSYISHAVFEGSPFSEGNESIDEGVKRIDAWLKRVTDENRKDKVDELKREWLKVFIGYGTPKAPCWQSYYHETSGVVFGAKTLEVREWYKKFGLESEKKMYEPDDHLGLMLSFLSTLAAQEITARETEDWDLASKLCDAQKSFLLEQVLPWLPAWYYLADKYTETDFYQGVTRLIWGILEEYAGLFSIYYKQSKNAFVLRE